MLIHTTIDLSSYSNMALPCVCDDGSEATYEAGEAYAISPGHDAWVVGDEPAVVYEFAGMWGE